MTYNVFGGTLNLAQSAMYLKVVKVVFTLLCLHALHYIRKLFIVA